MLSGLALLYAVLKARSFLLTCDEVYTLRIARQPTVAAMIALSRQIDLHPPLHYLAERWALRLPLPKLLGARLPSLLALVGTTVFSFRFAARRYGNVAGLFAGAALLLGPTIEFSWSNRPYAIWLCLTALSALIWQRAAGPRRAWWSAPALCLACAAMCLDYMGGVLCLGAFFAAEAVRWWRSRRTDWPVWVALLVPGMFVALYMQQANSFAANTFAPSYMPSLDRLTDMYLGMFQQPVLIALACVVAAVALVYGAQTATVRAVFRVRPVLSGADPQGYEVHERVLIVALTFIPALTLAAAAFRHNQFFPRYGAAGYIGVALLAPWLLARFVAAARVAAVLMSVAFALTMLVDASSANFQMNGVWRASQVRGVPGKRLDALDRSLPIAMANPADYTAMNEIESPELLGRVYYVTDRAAAQTYSGSTVFETEEQTAKLLRFASKSQPLGAFTAEHPRFYVVGNYTHPEEWLLRWAMANDETVQYLGRFESQYTDDDLWLVTVKR